MKKIIFSAFVLAGALTMSSCSEGAFGGDFEVGNTELVEMAGTWCCTVEVNDPYYTTQYYLSDYSAEFLNSYFGDPYGYYNPDANGDGVVDLADLESDEYAEWWEERSSGVFEFRTFNTANNNTTDMWVEDGYWATQTKVAVDFNNMTFEAPGTIVQGANEVETAAGVTTTLAAHSNTENDVVYGCGVVILGGKILKDAAHAPGSGMQTDSIIFYIKYDDDYGENIYTKVSGYRKTGYTEDD
ncbi:MAG: hypothetical protein J5543_03065 [Bacteroidales bacterium]|jgi:hypothetical protein|nr:hypothetical protein [Bacteroidales bacterium]